MPLFARRTSLGVDNGVYNLSSALTLDDMARRLMTTSQERVANQH